jgi:hypothetical protein
MFKETAHPNQTKLRKSDMPPRWGMNPSCMVMGYNHAAPPALDTLQTELILCALCVLLRLNCFFQD